MTSNEGALLAVRLGHLSDVKRALASGQLDRNLRDPYGATLLHLAARTDNFDLVKFLVEEAGHSTIARAENGALPSHDAAAAGSETSLGYLLQWGCPENACDHDGATILHLSVRFGHLNLLRYLAETRGMSIRDKDRKGASVIHYAAAKGDLDCLGYIVSVAPDIGNDRTENGATPMYFAAQNGHLECMQHLQTSSGANPHLRAVDGMQSVHAAAQTGQLHCIIWLVERQGVLPTERDNDGATPLHFAAGQGHSEIVRWLLSNGASCEKDNLGGTPLHDAAEHGHLECARILVDHGCDVNTEDRDFLVASELAKLCGHLRVAKFLRSVEKKIGNAMGKGHSDQQPQADHEREIKQAISSPTNTSSLSSVILSDRDSSCSVGTIDEEFDVRTGRYEVMESPEPIPDPPYVQIYEKLTDLGSDEKQWETNSSYRLKMLSKGWGMKEKSGEDKSSDVCTIGTQTDSLELPKENKENETNLVKSIKKVLKGTSPTRSLRGQSATEEPPMSSPTTLQLSKPHKTMPISPTKLSPEKKELRFSSTVMVEEITHQEDEDMTSPSTRNIQLIPLNKSPDANLYSPKTLESANTPSPPPLTNLPPPHLQTITPNRPTTIMIPPPPMKWPQHNKTNSRQNKKLPDVSYQWSPMTSTFSSPTTPPPPPPLPLSMADMIHNSPTNRVSPSLPGPPSPKDLASINLKPAKNISHKSSSSVGSKPSIVNADLIAEIQAGATLRKTQINGDLASRSSSPVEDKGPKVYYAIDFLDNIPLADENGIELPDWRRRFLAKKEADRANQRAAAEYMQQKQLKAEERKYRDMPQWKVELLKKKEKLSTSPKE